MATPALYAGNTNITGMQIPVVSAPKSGVRTAIGMPMGGASIPTPSTPSVVFTQKHAAPESYGSSAPNGLTVVPNPGGTSGALGGAVGTNTGAMSGISSREASRVLGENQNYLGQGMGALATNYLQSGAGYNGALAQQTVSATDNAMQQQINQQYGALQSSMAEAGLSPDSSGFNLGESEFLSNASAQENEVAANQYTQMYSQSQQDYLSELEQLQNMNFEGTMNQKTAMGALGSFLTGGVGGLVQYEGGAAGTAGTVTSTDGLFGSGVLSTSVGSVIGNLPGGEATTLAGDIF